MTFQFKCDSTNGFSEVSGSVSFSENGLKFEYQSNYLSLVKGDVNEVFIPFSQIEEIEYIKKFFTKKILIILNSLKNLDKFPIIEEYEINIPVKKKSIEKANEFVISANYHFGQYKLNSL
jgi:hypothetical protein